MEIGRIARMGATQLADCLAKVDERQLEGLADAIVAARSVFVCGAGRSLLMLRCLAMRLMHLGLTSHVVGDTTTPAFGEGDLLIAASASGSTSSVVNVAEKARALGGMVAAITILPGSTLGHLADYVVEVPAYTDKPGDDRLERPLLPGGSMFEQAVLLLGDALVLPLGKRADVPLDRAFTLHANLE